MDLVWQLKEIIYVPTVVIKYFHNVQEHIQKFPDWPPGTRTANGTALCH
jgi:hypothetical protein